MCREAGALVRVNAKLKDMSVEVPADDERAMEVLASGLPIHQGAFRCKDHPRMEVVNVVATSVVASSSTWREGVEKEV